jgi:hypothetical protein
LELVLKNAKKGILYEALEFIRKKSEFLKKGEDEELGELRFRHFQARLIDTLNRVLTERRIISTSIN